MLKKISKAYSVKEMPLSFTVIDFETTGLDPTNSAIIEIGAVRFTEFEPVAMFNTMVCQDPVLYPMSEEMTKLTGHTTEDIAKGLTEELAIDVLIQFIDDSLVVGQNILFDYSFLTTAAEGYGYALEHDLLDTLTIARDRKPYPHKLESLCKYYGVENMAWHSAYYDALATGQVLLAMYAEDHTYIAGKQVMDYVNVIGYKRKYGEPSWIPGWTTLKAQGSTTVQH